MGGGVGWQVPEGAKAPWAVPLPTAAASYARSNFTARVAFVAEGDAWEWTDPAPVVSSGATYFRAVLDSASAAASSSAASGAAASGAAASAAPSLGAPASGAATASVAPAGAAARSAQAAAAEPAYPHFLQCGESWSSDLMDTATVCSVGCLMSSTAMGLRGFNISIDLGGPGGTSPSPSDPGTLNAWLRANGGYDGHNDLIESQVTQGAEATRRFQAAHTHTKCMRERRA